MRGYMKYYIIYTKEGSTFDPNGEVIENCQILDWVEGNSKEDAIDRFKQEQPEIALRYSEFLVQVVVKL
jgi:hypothetical protein